MQEYYSLDAIDAENAQYNIIIGERSNGKTYQALKKIVSNWYEYHKQGAYIRRYQEDFRGKLGNELFRALIRNDEIRRLTEGKFDSVRYYSGRFYLGKFDEDLDKPVYEEDPFCFAFAISEQEHTKSSAFPDITTVVFDEFITRNFYLQNEFVDFMNLLSTIIRRRTDVKIYMLANTVNKYCPYFKEMGLKHITEMKQGSIDVYTYGGSSLKVAVEYCRAIQKKSKTNQMYFAFDNPSLAMITSGTWEVARYPHCPMKYRKKDVIFTFFILFDSQLLQCEIVEKDDTSFLFIHEKSTPLQDETSDIIFSDKYDPRPNWIRNIRKSPNPICRKLAFYFKDERVYYQDNDVGEIVRNYLNFCATS